MAISGVARFLLASSSGVVLATAALAQSSPTGPAPASSREGSAADAGADIVVTAQKREERLSQVPISISVLGGAKLEQTGVSGAVDALRATPGVAINVTNQGGTPQIAIRGVGATSSLFSGSTAIGYYLDSVPFSFPKTPIVPDANVYDLDRVEVLRGPQGTLYGASALNGVIRVLTREPNMSAFDLKVRSGVEIAEGASQPGFRGDAEINVPIIADKLAVRGVIGYQKVAGTIDSPNRKNIDDAKIQNYRFKIKATPTDRLTLGAEVWRSKSYYGAPTSSIDAGIYPFSVASSQSVDYTIYAGHINYESDSFSIQNTASAINFDNFGYLHANPLVTDLRLKSFSDELLVRSKSEGVLRWSFGGIYRNARDHLFQNQPTFFAPINFYDKSRSYAAFGELTLRLLGGKIELTGGGRYFHDDVDTGEYTLYLTAPANRPLLNSRQSFHATTPRFVATWHVDANALVYASYSEGFRSGFDQYATVKVQFPNYPAVNADKLRNYEVGSKFDLLDHKLSFDAALYYIKWLDVQQQLSVPITPGSSTFVTAPVNGSSASGLGFDLGVTARPVSRLSLNGTFSVNNLTEDKQVLSGTTVLFQKGDRLVLSPKYTAGGSIDYTAPLGGSGYKVDFNASASYISRMQSRSVSAGTLAIGSGDNLTILRTSVAIIAPSHWTATFYINNLTNDRGKTSQSQPITEPSPRLRPRTYGAQVEYHF